MGRLLLRRAAQRHGSLRDSSGSPASWVVQVPVTRTLRRESRVDGISPNQPDLRTSSPSGKPSYMSHLAAARHGALLPILGERRSKSWEKVT
jgi:hypothetical protein